MFRFSVCVGVVGRVGGDLASLVSPSCQPFKSHPALSELHVNNGTVSPFPDAIFQARCNVASIHRYRHNLKHTLALLAPEVAYRQ